MNNILNIDVLTLLLLSPLIIYSISLLIKENSDPFKNFHDDYSNFNQSMSIKGNSPSLKINRLASGELPIGRDVTTRNTSKLSSLLTLVRVHGRILSIYLGVLALCYMAGAKSGSILLGFVGLLAYLYWLNKGEKRESRRRQETSEQELPSIVELFSILVSAGESPASALLKISGVSHGEFPSQLRSISKSLQKGGNLKSALEELSRQNESLPIRRFCDSLIISIERGSSLSDVLSRQVEEIRSAQKANLLRQAGKVEIALMIPVVFLILPISILFALWPSYVALGQSII